MKNLTLSNAVISLELFEDNDVILRGLEDDFGRNMVTTRKRFQKILESIREVFDLPKFTVSYGTVIKRDHDNHGRVIVKFEVDETSNIPNCFWQFGPQLELSLTQADLKLIEDCFNQL